MKRFHQLPRKGFTLVELMIAIAIVAVLAALAIVGISRYLRSAQSSEAVQTVGAIARTAQAAFERHVAQAKLMPSGDSFASGATALCETAVPVPDQFSKIVGYKYQPDMTGTLDFNKGDEVTGWPCLRFSITTPIIYQYSYTKNGAPVATEANGQAPAGIDSGFEAGAMGDTDKNGSRSYFAVHGILENSQLKRSSSVMIVNGTDG